MIPRQHPLIAESGAKNSKFLPTPARGNGGFVDRDNSSTPAQADCKLIILHNRQIGEAPHFFKQGPGEEKSLVSVRSLEPA